MHDDPLILNSLLPLSYLVDMLMNHGNAWCFVADFDWKESTL